MKLFKGLFVLAGFILFLAGAFAQPLTVTTLAGQVGCSGSSDGLGSAAQFSAPTDVAVDGGLFVYVADTYNDTIRKIIPGGLVWTFAGSAGVSGSTDGSTTAARFTHPAGLAVNTLGDVCVADTDNNTVRRITPKAVVITIAGNAGASGSVDGEVSAARFNGPSGMSRDSAGYDFYVADTLNHTIRFVTLGGGAITVAGTAGVSGYVDGNRSAARFFGPQGLACDSSGNLYVADTNNNAVRKVDLTTGSVTTVAGGTLGSADGLGTLAQFNHPSGVTVDGAGIVYVADTDNDTIRAVTPSGAVTTIAGTAGASGSSDGVGSAVRFNHPTGIAVDSIGNIYIADTDNDTIRIGYYPAAPTIIATEPQSQTASVGNYANFSVEAVGRPMPTYQWYFNGHAISGGSGVTSAGGTVNSYTIDNVQMSNAGDYTVTVSNSSGSVTSSKVTLTVNGTTPPSSGGGEGNGGGGSMEYWFVGLLSLLASLRANHRPSRWT